MLCTISLVRGGELIVNGNVSGNVIAAGGSIKVNGNVGGDVAVFGGQIFLSRDSVVNGDVLLGGGEVTLDGVVNGNGRVSAGTLQTGDNFKLKGNLKLESQNYPSNLKDNVGGNLNITQEMKRKTSMRTLLKGLVFSRLFSGLLASLALGFILIYLFPGFVSRLAELVRDSAVESWTSGLFNSDFPSGTLNSPAYYLLRVEPVGFDDPAPGTWTSYCDSACKIACR